MSSPIRRQLFTNDDRASATLEFCLVIAPLIAIILLTLFVSVFLFIQTAMTHVVTTEARRIMTGEQARRDAERFKLHPEIPLNVAFRGDAVALLPLGIPTAPFSISVASGASWQDLQPSSASDNYDPGGPNSYVLVTATYAIPIVVEPFLIINNIVQKLNLPGTISVSVVVRSEAFGHDE